MVYLCCECGAVAEVPDGGIVRPCGHDGAGIKALLSATATGEAKVAS